MARRVPRVHRGRTRKAPQQRSDLTGPRRALGFGGSYDAVKRLARKLRGDLPKVSCRFETEPGQEAQVDYGEGALTRHPSTGKYRRPRLFVMTLGNSRHAFRKVVWKSSTEIWCKLHEEAFAYFGGVARTSLDNHFLQRRRRPPVRRRMMRGVCALMSGSLRTWGCPARAVGEVHVGYGAVRDSWRHLIRVRAEGVYPVDMDAR